MMSVSCRACVCVVWGWMSHHLFARVQIEIATIFISFEYVCTFCWFQLTLSTLGSANWFFTILNSFIYFSFWCRRVKMYIQTQTNNFPPIFWHCILAAENTTTAQLRNIKWKSLSESPAQWTWIFNWISVRAAYEREKKSKNNPAKSQQHRHFVRRVWAPLVSNSSDVTIILLFVDCCLSGKSSVSQVKELSETTPPPAASHTIWKIYTLSHRNNINSTRSGSFRP